MMAVTISAPAFTAFNMNYVWPTPLASFFQAEQHHTPRFPPKEEDPLDSDITDIESPFIVDDWYILEDDDRQSSTED